MSTCIGACSRDIKHGRMRHPAMLSFRPLALSDAALLRSFLPHFRERLCDYTMSGLLLWRDFFQTEIAQEAERLYIRHTVRGTGKRVYGFPQGPERFKGLERLLAHWRTGGEAPLLCNVSAGELEALRARTMGLLATPERDWFDYVYDAGALAEMAGPEYSAHRNHIRRFQRTFPQACYETLNADNLTLAAAFLERLHSRQQNPSEMLREEYRMLGELLAHLDTYGVFGGLMRDGERVLALSLGETLHDTLFVHTEKADPDAPGAYQMMAREFARHNAAGLRWINREEDMGIEGLRTSKMRYHPAELLEKSTVEITV